MRALVLLMILGCGGKQPPATNASDGSASPDCEPGRCLEDVSKLVLAHRTEARACYDDGRKRDPNIEGKLVIGFEFDARGTVVDAHQTVADDQFREDLVVACIVDVIKTIKFPPSKKGATTRAYHRFEFSKTAKP